MAWERKKSNSLTYILFKILILLYRGGLERQTDRETDRETERQTETERNGNSELIILMN